jgi:uncharacterized protein YggE
MRRTLAIALTVAAVPLVAWGCGTSDDAESGPAAGTGQTAAQPAPEPPTDADAAIASVETSRSPEPAVDAAPAAEEPAVLGTDAGISASAPAVADTAFISPPVYGAAVATVPGITVSGTGQVQVVPDAAQITFGVETQAGDAASALAANSTAMEKVVAALKAAGIDAADIQTQQVSVGQRYDSTGTSITGYVATNQVVTTVRKIDTVGAIIDTAVQAGATNVYGLGLTVTKPDEAYAQALDKAVANARTKAERLAKAAGVAVGKVVAVLEGGGGYTGPIPLAAEAARAKDVPIEIGTQAVTATVTVTYAVA